VGSMDNNWLTIVFRSLGALIMLFIIARILGKKHLAQLSFLEFVVGITLGELAGFISTALENHISHGLAALAVWTIVPLLMDYWSLKSKFVRDWFEGKPTVLIKDGKVLEDNLKKEKLTADEVLEHLRLKSIFKLADVEFAAMEPSGEVSVMLKKEQQPLTASTVGIKIGPEHEPQTVIIDGNVMDEPLATLGLSREWLYTELDKIGVTIENVFVGQVDTYGQLHVDLYDDQLVLPQPSNKELLRVTLRKCEADLELFALASDNPGVKRMYTQCFQTLKKTIQELEPYLKR
jgi:uncharacterized membrane protein YcaP (DUF421 family)